MSNLTQNFIDALGRLEQSRDVEAIAQLFAEDAEIANPLVDYQDGGPQAAKTFWSQYRDAFDDIRSEFRTVTEKDGTSFLEWTSRGAIDGRSFEYEGVSILESKGDKLSAFRTYFDTRHLPSPKKGAGNGAGAAESGTARGGSDTNAKAGESALERGQREAGEQRARGGYD